MSKNAPLVYCRCCGKPTKNKLGICSDCQYKAAETIKLIEAAKLLGLTSELSSLQEVSRFDRY